MSSCILFGPADATADFGGYEPMLRRSAVARSIYREVAELADIAVDRLIDGAVPHVHPVLLRWIRQMAAMLSMARIVQDEHGSASLYGGVSLGELAALHCAGATSTEVVLGFLRERHLQDNDREEAVGFAFVHAPADWRYYEQPERMTVSCDFGPVFDGAGRMIMVSGLRSALESARADGPAELQVAEPTVAHQAYHSPFREPSRVRLENYLDKVTMAPLRTPVVTAIPGMHALHTSAAASEALVVSETRQLHVPGLIESLRTHRPDKVIVISSFLRQLELDFHAPTEYIDDSWLGRKFP